MACFRIGWNLNNHLLFPSWIKITADEIPEISELLGRMQRLDQNIWGWSCEDRYGELRFLYFGGI